MDKLNSYRLREFRKLKREIRGLEEYLIVGIDVAKDWHHAFFGSATGKTLMMRLSLATTMRGSEGFWIRSRRCGCGMV